MLIGLDFDNTLIRFDDLFHRVALEKSLIPASLPAEKNTVRDYLRHHGREDEWTLMQGEVYGSRITEALPFKGVFDTLITLQTNGVRFVLVSHKTRTPFMGPPFDLHQAAQKWLSEQGFLDPEGLDWTIDQVFFELTKEDKVRRICELGCTYYVDDLTEILEMLPKKISRIQFLPQFGNKKQYPWPVMRSWKELPSLVLQSSL